MRKPRHILAMVGVLLAVASLIGGSSPQQIGVTRLPARLADPGGHSQFLWIAASELVDAEGRLDRTLLMGSWEEFVNQIEQRMAEAEAASASGAEPPACVGQSILVNYRHGSDPGLKKFADAIVAAETIIRGTVTGSAGGFLRDRPGLLLEVEVDERLRESPLHAESNYVYVFYYGGEFNIGAARICPSYRGWPDPPEIGDQIVVFPRRGQAPVDAAATIINPDQRGFELVFGNGGRIGLPPGLRHLPELQEEIDIGEVWRLTRAAFDRGKLEGGAG